MKQTVMWGKTWEETLSWIEVWMLFYGMLTFDAEIVVIQGVHNLFGHGYHIVVKWDF